MTTIESHPTWVRGLKRHVCGIHSNAVHVAPYVGAWIETVECDNCDASFLVAPYVGAWIETYL